MYDDAAYVGGSNYAPSIIGNQTVAFITGALAEGQSFFAYVSPHSPHSPAEPAPWYSGAFSGVGAPRTASFNVRAPCHHWAVAVQPRINFLETMELDGLARRRLQTLLTVDDIAMGITAALEQHGAMDSTYFIFTSDHGFHMGQHRLNHGKRMPYDTDLRVPLLVRGPGVGVGSEVRHLVGLPDLAPTILELAGAEVSGSIDGKSLVPLLLDRVPGPSHHGWRSAYLVEYIATQEGAKTNLWGRVGDNGNNSFRGLRFIDPAGPVRASCAFLQPSPQIDCLHLECPSCQPSLEARRQFSVASIHCRATS